MYVCMYVLWYLPVIQGHLCQVKFCCWWGIWGRASKAFFFRYGQKIGHKWASWSLACSVTEWFSWFAELTQLWSCKNEVQILQTSGMGMWIWNKPFTLRRKFRAGHLLTGVMPFLLQALCTKMILFIYLFTHFFACKWWKKKKVSFDWWMHIPCKKEMT